MLARGDFLQVIAIVICASTGSDKRLSHMCCFLLASPMNRRFLHSKLIAKMRIGFASPLRLIFVCQGGCWVQRVTFLLHFNQCATKLITLTSCTCIIRKRRPTARNDDVIIHQKAIWTKTNGNEDWKGYVRSLMQSISFSDSVEKKWRFVLGPTWIVI